MTMKPLLALAGPGPSRTENTQAGICPHCEAKPEILQEVGLVAKPQLTPEFQEFRCGLCGALYWAREPS